MRMRYVRNQLLFFGLSLLLLSGVAADPAYLPPKENDRLIALVSDLHLGLGRTSSGWHPYEDFRWPKALEGLLKHINDEGRGHTDLVIVGDFLELWQLPDDISCKGVDSEQGCTVEEIISVAQRVVNAHSDVFEMLRTFSQDGQNRLHVLPGNHDAALLEPRVWSLLAKVLESDSGHVRLAKDGFFASSDGYLVAEHGHQIPGDSNRFKLWPNVRVAGSEYLTRPFGERFVQKIFNETERDYPIIDNLSPKIAGAWYRMSDRGYAGTASDFARLLVFALFDTSISQKLQFLGDEGGDSSSADWDINYARQLGHKLIVNALPEEADTLRSELLDITSAKTEFYPVRNELDSIVQGDLLTDEQIRELCDILASNGNSQCPRLTLGEIARSAPGVRRLLLRQHLAERRNIFPDMVYFVYGHTHKLETANDIDLSGADSVTVHNTGAFQRLIEKDDYIVRLRKAYPSLSPAEGLAKFPLDKLDPCYTVVLAPRVHGVNRPKTWRWHMPEDGSGNLIEPTDQRCH